MLEWASSGLEEGWAAGLLFEEGATCGHGLGLDGAAAALLQVRTSRVLRQESTWKAFLEWTSAALLKKEKIEMVSTIRPKNLKLTRPDLVLLIVGNRPYEYISSYCLNDKQIMFESKGKKARKM